MGITLGLQLATLDAVVYRTDLDGGHMLDPVGPKTTGMDDTFREPIVFDVTSGASVGSREVVRVELPPVRIPCQVEATEYGMLTMGTSGQLPATELVLVFFRPTLVLLGLIDALTNNFVLKNGDRVSMLEKHNLRVPALTFPGTGFYVTEVHPASFGFGGVEGYDLQTVTIKQRDLGAH